MVDAGDTIRDVTARQQAEEALRESEARFRSLFESMTEGVALHELIYDNQSLAVDYRIVSTNPAFEKHTGLKSEQIQGQLASSAYGTGAAPYLEEYARVAQTGRAYAFEPCFPRCSGTSISPSPHPGRVNSSPSSKTSPSASGPNGKSSAWLRFPK